MHGNWFAIVSLRKRVKCTVWIVFIGVVHSSKEHGSNTYDDISENWDNSSDNLWKRALNTMSYHRNMMNEYLCRNYLANEIMGTLRNESMNKRIGLSAEDVRLMRQSMLEDSGSRKYKDWLSRSTTLEDIYRHYEGSPDGELQESQTGPIGDGEVTGYALLGDKVAGHGIADYNSGYGYHHYEHYEEDDDHEDKSVKLKEIFDLALTAIAFLAFGTFITETMIHGFAFQNQEAQMMIVSPMPGVNGISFKSNFEGMPLPIPQERSITNESFPSIVLNEMSRQVLTSIEALTIADRDGGKCLRRSLCEINKYSRSLPGTQKIWLPLWSFGTSWVAGKFMKGDEYSLLENLKASLFGFGNSDCTKLYRKCEGKLHKKRR